MKIQSSLTAKVAASFVLLISSSDIPAFAQGTAFTYQGRLSSGSGTANGLYDFRFKTYADALGNTQVGSSCLINAVGVTNGLFIATLDFGAGIFTGQNLWLEVDVKTNAGASYTVLTPLQAVTPAPYAITAANVSGTSSGNGASLTNVNAATLNGLSAANFWQLGGNNLASGQFLGSTNNQPVEVWVNGERALRLEAFEASTPPNVIGGAAGNYVAPGVNGATIGGGGWTGVYTNSVIGDYGVVAGGVQNSAGQTGFVGGGTYNTVTASGVFSAIAGGIGNTASGVAGFIGAGGLDGTWGLPNFNAGNAAVVVGGCGNSIKLSNNCSAILGGYENVIPPNSSASAIGGGSNNLAGGIAATVPGGVGNQALGNFAFAAGQLAIARYQGDFVWADSQALAFNSTAGDQFLIRAQGGVGIGTNHPTAALEAASASGYPQLQLDQQLNDYARIRLAGYTNAFWDIAAQSELNFFCAGYGNVLTLLKNGRVGISSSGTPGTYLQVVNATCNGSSWVNASDRNLKQNFAPVNPAEVLAKVVALPVQSWDYKAQPGDKHIGPVAQDFHAAFGLNGGDDRHIATVDESGVALAAIQGLNQKMDEKDAKIAELEQRLNQLEKLLEAKNR